MRLEDGEQWLSWEEWRERQADRIFREAVEKGKQFGSRLTRFENQLSTLERWAYDLYEQHLGCSLGGLEEVARNEGCPHADVTRLWNKLVAERKREKVVVIRDGTGY
jgi:hypothetical protein